MPRVGADLSPTEDPRLSGDVEGCGAGDFESGGGWAGDLVAGFHGLELEGFAFGGIAWEFGFRWSGSVSSCAMQAQQSQAARERAAFS